MGGNEMAEKRDNRTQSGEFFEDMRKFQIPGFHIQGFDYESTMQMYRKNLEVFAQAQKALLDMVKEVTHLNSEYTRRVMEDMREHHKQLTEAKTLEERSQLTTDNFKDQMDHLLAHNRKVTDIWTKSCASVGERLSNRVQDNVKEAQGMMQRAASGRH
jgi:phasin family protein